MLRIVNLGRTGVYVAMRGGVVATLGGRCYWSNIEDLRRAARQANATISDHIVRTSA